MAMSNSLGVGSDAGKTMAMNLTGLVGDIASFYNITVEEANTAISAVYTGETESIKKLGIVLTEANLNAYAVSQGIKKTYNQMSQAEKVMLRYNYVMQASAKIQGDFVRTGGNWANQVRVLKEQWSQLLGILGKGLIAVLNPVVKALNSMLASLIAVANAMAKAFGGTGIESSTGKVSSTVGDIADGAGDVTSGFDDANASAKALKNTLAGFDELNVLSSPDAGGGGVNIGGDVSTEGTGDLNELPEAESSASKLADYLQQCKDILDKWIATIPKLQINFDKEKAIEDLKNIGLNIWNTIAGWGTFVVSLAIEVANDLDIGKLANSFLSLIESATGLASAITDAVVPALQTFYQESGLKEIVKWIGEKFAQGMDGLADTLDDWAEWFVQNKEQINTFAENLGKAVKPIADIVIQIGDVAWTIFAGVLSTINDLLMSICDSLINMDVDKLRTLMLSLAGLGGAFGLAKSGAELFGISLLEIITHPGTAITSFFTLLHDVWLPALGVKFAEFGSVIKAPFVGLKGLIGSLATTFAPVLTAMQTAYSSTVSAIGASSGVLTTIKGLVAGVGAGFKALWGILSAHPIALIITAIIACITALANLWKNSEEFRQFVTDIWENTIKPVFKGVADAVKDLWEQHLKPLWENSLKPLFKQVGDAFKGLWDTISEVVGWVVGIIGGVFLSTFTSTFGSILTSVIETIGSVLDTLSGLIDFVSGVFSGDWSKAWEGVKKIFKGVWDSLVNVVKAPINLIIGLVNGLVNGICQGVNAIIRNINKLSWKVPDWVPAIGGSTFGFNLKTLTAPQIPYLAKGGVITEPTVAMMGEYAGAYNNPEIVTPQNLLQQVIENSNQNVVDALIQQTRQLLVALEDIDMSVTIGDEQIAQSAQRGNLAYKRRTGKPLFA